MSPHRTRVRSLLVTGLAGLFALLGVLTAAPAHAASRIDSMPLSYQSLGIARSAGTADFRLNLSGTVNRPTAYGNFVSIQPANGWNAVAYGTQTKITCLQNQRLDATRYYSLCYVNVKMEKPGTWQAGVSGTIRGISFNLGYSSGSGREFVFLRGTVEVYRFQAGSFSVCPSWKACYTVAA